MQIEISAAEAKDLYDWACAAVAEADKKMGRPGQTPELVRLRRERAAAIRDRAQAVINASGT